MITCWNYCGCANCWRVKTLCCVMNVFFLLLLLCIAFMYCFFIVFLIFSCLVCINKWMNEWILAHLKLNLGQTYAELTVGDRSFIQVLIAVSIQQGKLNEYWSMRAQGSNVPSFVESVGGWRKDEVQWLCTNPMECAFPPLLFLHRHFFSFSCMRGTWRDGVMKRDNQPANPFSPGRMAVKPACVCVFN